MVNLLPQAYEKILHARIYLRFMLAGTTLLLIGGILAVTALLPSFLSLYFITPSGASEVSIQVPNLEKNRTIVTNAQSLISGLKSEIASTSPSNIMAIIINERPKSIALDQISYQGGSPGSITITGAENAHGGVDQYRTVLSKNPLFSHIAVPVASLIGAEDGRFTMTITGTF